MGQKIQILIIEDEQSIVNVLTSVLANHGYRAISCRTGKEGLMMAASYCPSVILLDLGLPDMDGNEVIRALREWSAIPVIVLSARTQERDKIDALDCGADDYITKPFSTGELLARIRTALRHISPARNTKSFTVGDLTIDFENHQVKVGESSTFLDVQDFAVVRIVGNLNPDMSFIVGLIVIRIDNAYCVIKLHSAFKTNTATGNNHKELILIKFHSYTSWNFNRFLRFKEEFFRREEVIASAVSRGSLR